MMSHTQKTIQLVGIARSLSTLNPADDGPTLNLNAGLNFDFHWEPGPVLLKPLYFCDFSGWGGGVGGGGVRNSSPPLDQSLMSEEFHMLKTLQPEQK